MEKEKKDSVIAPERKPTPKNLKLVSEANGLTIFQSAITGELYVCEDFLGKIVLNKL